ncbi:hypothetical protein PESP_b0689 [Pseudoalteromonas espejiana DSM 9414]|nr:hypothetical protein PESP_b0689 [Pseudoalteromonas espejiana DSM 9414]
MRLEHKVKPINSKRILTLFRHCFYGDRPSYIKRNRFK